MPIFESSAVCSMIDAASTVQERVLGAGSVVALPFMLVVLPLFLLGLLTVTLGAVPGLVIHNLAWSKVNMHGASEQTKLVHDFSLLFLGGVSAVLVCVYVFPNVLPEPDPYNRCSTEPYC